MSSLAKHSGCSGQSCDSQLIFESVSQGLHRAAQPLTVLHGILEHALLDVRTLHEYRAVLLQLRSEAHRLTTSFDDLREILRRAELALKPADKLDYSPTQEVDSECSIFVETEREHV